MFEKLFKNIHWLIILYYAGGMALQYEEKSLALQQTSQQVEVIEVNIRKAEREKRQLQDFQQDIDEARNRVELVAQEVERIQRQLPSEISDTENLSIIRKAAEDINIKEISLNPGAERSQGFYFIKEYEFSGKGTFLQFLIFFERIGESQRILNINSVNLIRSAVEQRGRFQLIDVKATIEAYRYNQDHREDRGFDAAAEAAAEPAKEPEIPAGNIRRR